MVNEIPSVNHYVAHSNGRHFKSAKSKEFEKAVMAQLAIEFGNDFKKIYSRYSRITGLKIIFTLRKGLYKRDLDNMPKLFIDCIARHFGFNDSKITKLALEKKIDKTIFLEKIQWEAI
jgi:Holliday junction resolvase RusA-like endonuclease